MLVEYKLSHCTIDYEIIININSLSEYMNNIVCRNELN